MSVSRCFKPFTLLDIKCTLATQSVTDNVYHIVLESDPLDYDRRVKLFVSTAKAILLDMHIKR